MPETQQAKEINAPTILHTIGIGVTVGIIGCAIFFSIVDHSPISIEYILAFFLMAGHISFSLFLPALSART